MGVSKADQQVSYMVDSMAVNDVYKISRKQDLGVGTEIKKLD